MRTIPVKSSNLREIGYDPTSHELRVVFASGAVHDYSGVSPERYAGLMSAESHGKYFAEHIKRHHPAAKGRRRGKDRAHQLMPPCRAIQCPPLKPPQNDIGERNDRR